MFFFLQVSPALPGSSSVTTTVTNKMKQTKPNIDSPIVPDSMEEIKEFPFLNFNKPDCII